MLILKQALGARFWRWAGAAFFACARLSPLFAADSSAVWYHRDWQTEDGLPSANVTGIVQTHDGYLWLATQSGLVRFDGVQFEERPIPTPGAHLLIRLMLCDHAENLWLAQDRGVVVRIGAQQAKMFTASDGLPDSLPLQMIEDNDHNIWICYANRSVFRITPEGKVAHVTAAEGFPDDGLCSLAVDAQGKLWYAKGLQYGFLDGGHFQKSGSLEERNPQILAARRGGLWFCTSSQLLKMEPKAAPAAAAVFDTDAGRVKPSALFEDAGGRVWIGTAGDGLLLLDGKNIVKVDTSQNTIRAIAEDHEGNIWVGTEGGGLDRLRKKEVELFGREEGLPFETVRSLAEDRAGDLWVVGQDGSLLKLPKGNWANEQKFNDWKGGQAHCVVADKSGAIWIGTFQHGLFRWLGGTFTQISTGEGLAGQNVRSLMVDSHNSLWIGLQPEHLVQRLRGDSFQTFTLPADCAAVRAMAEDAGGKIWMGTLDGRLFGVDGGDLSEVAQPATVPSRPIRCLCALPDGNVWIGYAGSGVCRLRNGVLTHLGRKNGLFDGNICALLPDPYGRMWFASDLGIFYVTLAEMNNFVEGRANAVESIFFGRDAGLPSLQAYYGYWPGAMVDSRGEILFPTHSGIAIVHPDRVQPNTQAPNVMIQRVLVDGQPLEAAGGNRPIRLPPDHRRIEVTFTAPSFIAPEQVRFRYRLEGWNDEWSETVRPRSAIFTRLPAGDYKFQVTAGNSSEVWNSKGASFSFAVEPFFWQTWWFRGLAAAIFTAGVVALARHFSFRNVRLKLRRVEQEAALQKERTRIAQDMHDELGARFTQISLLGELSRNALPEPDKARDLLGQISHVAQVGVKSLDEIVWAVNPRNDTLPDLLDYTGQYARDFLFAADLWCRLEFPDEVPSRPIPGDVRHAIFSILKEALHNVVKHARAARVKISFELVDSQMRWTIEDDGRGFEQAPNNALADGLRNIGQRAAALKGKVEIQSHPGAGTRIILTVPLRNGT